MPRTGTIRATKTQEQTIPVRTILVRTILVRMSLTTNPSVAMERWKGVKPVMMAAKIMAMAVRQNVRSSLVTSAMHRGVN